MVGPANRQRICVASAAAALVAQLLRSAELGDLTPSPPGPSPRWEKARGELVQVFPALAPIGGEGGAGKQRFPSRRVRGFALCGTQ